MADAQRQTGKLAVILHADVAGSTTLVQQDEHLAHERIQDAFRRFGETIVRFHGHVRELRGDALLAEFERASDAVTAAVVFQIDHKDQNARLSGDIRPTIRVGIALGEVIIADNTVTGAGVVLAQRVEQLAEPGGVCITGAISEALPQRLPLEHEDLGEQQVKGFDKPVRVYRITLESGQALPQPEPGAYRESSSRRRNSIIAAVGAAVAITGGSILWLQPWAPEEEPASIERMAFPLPDKPSIAVLPFSNLSDDETNESFTDGITNDIITDLTQFSNLFVIASNSTFTYKGKAVKVQQVAEDLGVRYVLEGSVQTTADRIRINAQLIDATSGRHLWAERYDREIGDLFAIQNEIIETIVSTLAFRVEATERERALRKDTESLDAYDNYLRGTVYLYRFTKEAHAKAAKLYERAIELDPKYARAISRLAWVHVNAYQNSWSEDPEASIERALELAQRAAALAPDDYFSYWTLGYIHLARRDFDLSEAVYERAYSLNPNDAEFLSIMATALLYLGRPNEAVEEIKRAMRLNPHHPEIVTANLGWAYYDAGRYEDAVKTYRSMNDPPPYIHRGLAVAYVRSGKLDEARREIAQMLEKEPDYTLENFKVWPFKHEEDIERWIEDLREAGVPEKPPLAFPEKPSIAVLPFTNMSNNAEQEYFVDGMTEDLITDLSKISGLFVIARNSSFAYKGKSAKVKQVARELGVRYVLEGSVRRAGNQVRINAQLIDASSEGHLWADRYDGSLQDIFGLQDQVTQQIVMALKVNLTSDEQAQHTHRGTDNADAHDAYLQGWAHYKLGTPADLARSVPYFEDAIRLDSDYPHAHAALAAVYWDAYVNDWAFDMDMPSFRAESWANEHLEKALKEPTPLAYALQSRMFASSGFHNEALEEARKAVALDPNNSTALAGLANAMIFAERPGDGLALIQDAMRLDPHYPPSYLIILGAAQFGVENYEEAVATFERAVKRNLENELPAIYLASCYGHLGRISEGEAVIESVNDLRFSLGKSELSLEPRSSSDYSPFRGGFDFTRVGGKKAQERLRAGLSDIPALKWQYLVVVLAQGASTTYEIKGATRIDLATAKSFNGRDVLFIDVGTEAEGQWKKGRVPGAINLPWKRDPDDPSRKRIRQTTLSEIADKTQEIVFYWWAPGSPGIPAFATAKAVNWGYQKVYYFKGGAQAWKEAGYPIETD